MYGLLQETSSEKRTYKTKRKVKHLWRSNVSLFEDLALSDNKKADTVIQAVREISMCVGELSREPEAYAGFHCGREGGGWKGQVLPKTEGGNE